MSRNKPRPKSPPQCQICGGPKELIGEDFMCCTEFVYQGIREFRDTKKAIFGGEFRLTIPENS